MSCYLCAYGKSEVPESHQALPDWSSADVHTELATCSKCYVWACSSHGTRYGMFECAICTPASAVVAALTASPANAAAAAMAYSEGTNADPALLDQTHTALQKIVVASRAAQGIDTRSLVAPGQGEPNLISNLADVIRSQDRSVELFTYRATQFEGENLGIMSIDAIGAAVWTRFSGRQLAEPNTDAARIAAGALLLAYSLAEPSTSVRGIYPYQLPPPWQAARPIFLDPVLWLLGTALREN